MCLTYFHYWISHRRSDKDVETESSVRRSGCTAVTDVSSAQFARVELD